MMIQKNALLTSFTKKAKNLKKKIIVTGLAGLLGLAPALAEEKEVTIAGWGGDNVAILHKLVKEVLADDFKSAGIKIKYTPIESDFNVYLMNSLSSGTAPDVFYTDIVAFNPIIASGKVLPNLSVLQSVTDGMVKSLNEAFTLNGTQYGVPKDFNTLALVYNKDLFDDANVPYPDVNDNWEDLLSKLKRIKESVGDEVVGMCLMPSFDRFGVFALSTGWKPFNEQGKTVLDERFVKAFKFYTSLKKEGVAALVSDLGHNWTGGCFGAEKSAVALEGSWLNGYLKDKAPNLQYGAVLPPKNAESGQRGNLLFTVAWNINKDTKDSALASKAVEILTSEKAQKWILESGLALPSRKSLEQLPYFSEDIQENKMAKVVFDGASDGNVQPYSFGKYGSAWQDPINEALNAVFLDRLTVDEAIKQAQEKYDRMMK